MTRSATPGQPFTPLPERSAEDRWITILCNEARARLMVDGATQRDLAAELGVSPAHLSNVFHGRERGTRRIIATIAGIAALQVVTIGGEIAVVDARTGQVIGDAAPAAEPARPALVASYRAWPDVPACPCEKSGPHLSQRPHIWQIRTRHPACTVHVAVSATAPTDCTAGRAQTPGGGFGEGAAAGPVTSPGGHGARERKKAADAADRPGQGMGQPAATSPGAGTSADPGAIGRGLVAVAKTEQGGPATRTSGTRGSDAPKASAGTEVAG